jgi:hypothetical protein
MSRNKTLAIRSALHQAEIQIPKADRSKQAEKERDLVSEACVALWDGKMPKLWTCLRRLMLAPDRGANYAGVAGLLNG